VTRLRWTGDGFVPCPDQGDVRIVDSWLVTDGRARAVDAHLRRFCTSCVALYQVRAEGFARAALARIPVTGRWFPRLELAASGDGKNWLQPDLPYLASLRDAADGAEPLLVSAAGHVLEGATTSLLWWRGNTLCAPPASAPILPSVTRALLLDTAAARGIPVRFDLATPDELRALPSWAVNALHGVRPAVFR
jgi:branched-subunit amino acid aminotransferase/4-amino-4-deoxychorismate lyase